MQVLRQDKDSGCQGAWGSRPVGDNRGVPARCSVAAKCWPQRHVAATSGVYAIIKRSQLCCKLAVTTAIIVNLYYTLHITISSLSAPNSPSPVARRLKFLQSGNAAAMQLYIISVYLILLRAAMRRICNHQCVLSLVKGRAKEAQEAVHLYIHTPCPLQPVCSFCQTWLNLRGEGVRDVCAGIA